MTTLYEDRKKDENVEENKNKPVQVEDILDTDEDFDEGEDLPTDDDTLKDFLSNNVKKTPPVSGKRTNPSNNFACGFPKWLKRFIPVTTIIIIGLLLWNHFDRLEAVIDHAGIQDAIDGSTTGMKINFLEDAVLGNDDDTGLVEKINEINKKIDSFDESFTGSINQVNTTITQLNVTVNAQNEKIDNLQITVDKIANQLLGTGHSLRRTTGQFGWAKTKLTHANEVAFIQDILPEIKKNTTDNPDMIVRVVGRVDRSSTSKVNDGQVKVGNGRANYIAKILRDNGVKVTKTTWAYSYSPNRRVVDVYVELPK
ncbi:MAG: hypothetical protein ABIH48_02750 [Candidatus Falkowbacteria bacterium]